MVELLQKLADTEFSQELLGSAYMWGIINGVHVLGLGLFVGLILFWDLRLMNLGFRTIPVSVIWKRLIPWITIGFAIMAISGGVLFVADPVRYYGNLMFRVKAVALVLAGLNAAAFHFGIEKQLIDWDTAPTTPLAAKLAGACSMGLWIVIIFLGRLIAYNWFAPRV